VKFVVRLTKEAEDDLERLFEALLARASVNDDFVRAVITLEGLKGALEGLADSALRCRKAGDGRDPALRELVIPFGRAGYLALFDIAGDAVVLAAVRHQLESDYH
jgi:plasmid stabilization system protein ParE